VGESCNQAPAKNRLLHCARRLRRSSEKNYPDRGIHRSFKHAVANPVRSIASRPRAARCLSVFAAIPDGKQNLYNLSGKL
jgi:hypothetical protein